MRYEEALSSRPAPMKKMNPVMREMVLKKADNGGIIAEHRMSEWNGGKEPVHTFSASEGAKFAQHIQKHMGMQIPGNMADGKETEDERA